MKRRIDPKLIELMKLYDCDYDDETILRFQKLSLDEIFKWAEGNAKILHFLKKLEEEENNKN